MVYCFLPETAGRTLEAIDFLFASKSPFTWDEEKEFRVRMDEFESGQRAFAEKTREADSYLEQTV